MYTQMALEFKYFIIIALPSKSRVLMPVIVYLLLMYFLFHRIFSLIKNLAVQFCAHFENSIGVEVSIVAFICGKLSKNDLWSTPKGMR